MRCPSCLIRTVEDADNPWVKVCEECKEIDAAAVRIAARAMRDALAEIETPEQTQQRTKEIREATATRVAAWRERRRQQ